MNTPEEVKELTLLIDDRIVQANITPETQTIALNSTDYKVGFRTLKMTYVDGSGKQHADTRKLIFFSDIVPKYITVSEVSSNPHNPKSYTQGLEFYKGELYEGTGHYNKSILAKVDLKTGSIVKKHELASKYFGEGITILNDTIYQITWNEHTCLMYDMEFNEIGQFTYNGEGWGLTNDGEYIIMTNGSSEIVWRDPRTFEIVKTINVFSNESEVVNLNECELINGRLLINVYTETYLIEVDTASGKVLQEIDCFSLANAQPNGVDHLNGIAYDKGTGKLYVTGKWWPTLYEIKIDGWEN